MYMLYILLYYIYTQAFDVFLDVISTTRKKKKEHNLGTRWERYTVYDWGCVCIFYPSFYVENCQEDHPKWFHFIAFPPKISSQFHRRYNQITETCHVLSIAVLLRFLLGEITEKFSIMFSDGLDVFRWLYCVVFVCIPCIVVRNWVLGWNWINNTFLVNFHNNRIYYVAYLQIWGRTWSFRLWM